MNSISIKILLLSFAITIAGGCATVQYSDTNIIPEAKENQSLVIFYREKMFAGSGVSYYIKLNDKPIGALKSGTYFYIYLKPGEYTFSASTEVTKTITINTEAGQTYYVKGSVTMGVMAGRPKLIIADKQEAKEIIPTLRMTSIE